MIDLNLLSDNDDIYSNDCSPECLPFEESLNKDLRNAKEKTQEELDKEWEAYCEESREQADEYLKIIEKSNDFDDDDNDDEYSSGEAIPDCNPWRE